MSSNTGIERLSATEAWTNFRNNTATFWPMRDKVRPGCNRFKPLPAVEVVLPKLRKDSKIMTLGSCFASNLLKYLSFYSTHSINYDYLQQCSENDIQWTNIYTPTVFTQFVQMAKEIHVHGQLSEKNQQMGIVPSGDKYQDLMFTIERAEEPLSLSETLKRRDSFIRKFICNIFEADYIVITLGLVESWFDTVHQTYINVTPSEQVIQADPERFEFRVLDHSEVIASLRLLIQTVQSIHPKTPDFIFTVSPVPLQATFRAQDVVISNFYSKSLLRSSIEPLLSEYENVYYYPSFEILLHTDQVDLWTNDLRHIHPRYITHVIRCFADNALDSADFDAVDLHGTLLTCMTEMLSETNDTPDNAIREVGVGFYNLFPAALDDSLLATLEQLYLKYQHLSDIKAVQLAKLIVLVHRKDFKSATQVYVELVERYTFLSSYEVAILAGYGLQLKQADAVISVLSSFYNERHEYWQMYQHYFVAYCQKSDFQMALRYADDCYRNHEMIQWLFVDARAPVFINQILKISRRAGDERMYQKYNEIQRIITNR